MSEAATKRRSDKATKGVVGPSVRPPLALLGAALLAFAAINEVVRTNTRQASQSFILLPICAALVVLAYLLPLRLPPSAILGWILRGAAFAAVIFFSPPRRAIGVSPLFEPAYAHMGGYLCAVELTLRFWLYRGAVSARLEMLILSVLIFTAASNNWIWAHFRWLAPPFALAIVLAARELRPADASGVPRTDRRDWKGWAWRAIALSAALGIGYSGSEGILTHGDTLLRWGSRLMSPRPKGDAIGMSGSPRLSAVFNPTASTRRVLRIEGVSGFMHLRGLVYASYQTGGWGPREEERKYKPVPSALSCDPAQTAATVFREPEELDLLYLPLNTAAVSCEDALEWDPRGDVLRRPPAGVPLACTYRIRLAGRTEAGPLTAGSEEDAGWHYLEVPKDIDGRVRELAQRITGGAGSPDAKAWAVARHLADNHQYSLRYDPGDGDPISNFLLNNGSAHCQYFASSAVMLLRSSGVPARYVDGYVAHESDGPAALIARQRDAHAWVEYHDGKLWQTLEVTPPSGRPEQAPPVPFWRRWIERLGDLWRSFKAWAASLGWQGLSIASVSLIGLALLIQAIKNRDWRRVRRQRQSEYVSDPALAALARRFAKLLRRLTGPLAPDRTWREHLGSLPVAGVGDPGWPASSRPATDIARQRESLMEFIRLYEIARFDRADPATISQLTTLYNQLATHN